MGVNGGHFVCYRLKVGEEHLRASFAEQDESGVISHEASSQKPVSITEYEANEMLLPRLLRFSEEYRAVKVGQLEEGRRAKEEADARAPSKSKARLGRFPGAASTGQSWRPKPSSPEKVMNKTAPGSFALSPVVPNGSAESYDDRIEKPRLICRCGHGDIWHTQPKKSRDPLALTDVTPQQQQLTIADAKVLRQLPNAPAPSLGRALPVDDVSRRGAATIRNGRLVFSKVGSSALQQSASAPTLEPFVC
jgi:hypothetical protein